MAPVVTGDLKSSVRVRLRRYEAGSDSASGGWRPIAVGMQGPGESSRRRARRSGRRRARALDRVTDLRARLGPPTPPLQLGDILVSQGALTHREPAPRAGRATANRRTPRRDPRRRGYVHRLDVYRALSDAWGIATLRLLAPCARRRTDPGAGARHHDLAGAARVPLGHETARSWSRRPSAPRPSWRPTCAFAARSGSPGRSRPSGASARCAFFGAELPIPRLVRTRRPRARRPASRAVMRPQVVPLSPAWPRWSASASWRR